MSVKEKSRGEFILIGIIVMIIGAGLYIYNRNYMSHGDPVNINELLKENNYNLDTKDMAKKSNYVTLTINSCFGSFAKQNYDRSDFTVGDGTFYAVYLEDNTVMTIKVKDQYDKDRLDQITSETIASKNLHSKQVLTLEGWLCLIYDSELKGYYDDAMEDLGIKDYNNKVENKKDRIKIRYIYLDATKSKGALGGVAIIVFVMGLLFTFVDLTIFVIQKRAAAKMPAPLYGDNRDSGVYVNTPYQVKNPAPVNSAQFDSPMVDPARYDSARFGSEPSEPMQFDPAQYDSMPARPVPGTYNSNDDYYDPNPINPPKDNEEPRFGTPERHERTEDNKISISGRNLVK